MAFSTTTTTMIEESRRPLGTTLRVRDARW
jgi:hypothetical protein